jgi:hypothetical protein
MNFDGSGSDPTDPTSSRIQNHNPLVQHPVIKRRRSRNPEKLALPIRSFTLDRDDQYDDEEDISPGEMWSMLYYQLL